MNRPTLIKRKNTQNSRNSRQPQPAFKMKWTLAPLSCPSISSRRATIYTYTHAHIYMHDNQNDDSEVRCVRIYSLTSGKKIMTNSRNYAATIERGSESSGARRRIPRRRQSIVIAIGMVTYKATPLDYRVCYMRSPFLASLSFFTTCNNIWRILVSALSRAQDKRRRICACVAARICKKRRGPLFAASRAGRARGGI